MIWMSGARSFSKMSNDSVFGQLERPASRELRSAPHSRTLAGDSGSGLLSYEPLWGFSASLFRACGLPVLRGPRQEGEEQIGREPWEVRLEGTSLDSVLCEPMRVWSSFGHAVLSE